MYLRLRQIALVARALEPVERLLTACLGTAVCYRDPGVGRYGLHNALWALGGTFLEVVAPTREGTAAGRYLDRRHGDGGYMFIVDCDDLEARRSHFQAMGVRIVEDIRRGDEALWSEALHLHPRDTGGCLLSVDRHSGGADRQGGYRWAGPDWQARARADLRIAGATMQCADPGATAARWGELLRQQPEARAPGVFDLRLDDTFARFVALEDDRGEGLSVVHLAGADRAAVFAAARAAGARIDERAGGLAFAAGGVRFDLVP
ncbi:MAG: VOC family protein [Burkholderiales bacterium]|nr:VOC family protein [Burkholderiales bacterium]